MTEMFSMFEEDEKPAATPEPAESPTAARLVTARPQLDDWEASLPGLMTDYPNVKLGTLFCVYKVRLNPDVDFRDLQGEAQLRSIPLSGRSHHQARVLLGLEQARPQAPRRKKAELIEDDPREPRANGDLDSSDRGFAAPLPAWLAPRRVVAEPTDAPAALGGDLETMLRLAIAEAVERETAVYRDAIRDALALIEAVIAEDDEIEHGDDLAE